MADVARWDLVQPAGRCSQDRHSGLFQRPVDSDRDRSNNETDWILILSCKPYTASRRYMPFKFHQKPIPICTIAVVWTYIIPQEAWFLRGITSAFDLDVLDAFTGIIYMIPSGTALDKDGLSTFISLCYCPGEFTTGVFPLHQPSGLAKAGSASATRFAEIGLRAE